MKNVCNLCGHINGHAPGCPEAPEPEPIYTCFHCGGDIFAGDTVFEIDGQYCCCECCGGPYTAEAPEYERDWDLERKSIIERNL